MRVLVVQTFLKTPCHKRDHKTLKQNFKFDSISACGKEVPIFAIFAFWEDLLGTSV